MKKIFIFIIIIAVVSNCLVSSQGEKDKKEMSLKDAIYHALKNNLGLHIQMQTSEYNRNNVIVNNAIFIPTLDLQFDTQKQMSPSSSFIDGADINESESFSLTTTLNQKLAIGGTLSVSLYNRRYETNSQFSTVNPSLYSRLTISLNQPLLKNFGTFATKNLIYIAANDYNKSKQELKQNIIDLVYSVEEAYWNLVYAYQNLNSKKLSLQRSKDFLHQNEVKVKVGILAPIDILEAKSGVALGESQLISAEQLIQTSEDNLKNILNMTHEKKTLFPTDKPQVQKIVPELNSYLLEALQKRPDIEKQKLELLNQKINVKYARNQTLPDLQLAASYYSTGQGGDEHIYEGGTIFGGGVLVEIIEKELWEAMKDAVSNLYQNYSISLTLSIPLSMEQERAKLTQAKINLKSALLSLKNVENNVYSEVKGVIKELETNFKLVEANKIAEEVEKQKLEAEEKKLAVGLSDNFKVVTYQASYFEAQSRTLQSIINYNLSLAKINKILGKTFEAYDIKLKNYTTLPK